VFEKAGGQLEVLQRGHAYPRMGPEFNNEGFRITGSDDLHLGEGDRGASSLPPSPAAEGGVGDVMLLGERCGREPAAFELRQEVLASGDTGAGAAGRPGQEDWFHVPASYRISGRSGRGSLLHRLPKELSTSFPRVRGFGQISR